MRARHGFVFGVAGWADGCDLGRDTLGLGFVCTLDLFPLPEGSSCHRSPGPYAEPPVHRVGGCAIYESEKATNALVGSTFVQPTCVTFEGRSTLVFVFSVRIAFLHSSSADIGAIGLGRQVRRRILAAI